MSANDFVALFGGSNDVYKNETSKACCELEKHLAYMSHVNVLIVNIPHRHDLPHWSCVNKEITAANKRFLAISQQFKNVTVVDISNIGRRFHTSHGLHLNGVGKLLVTQKILDAIKRQQQISTTPKTIPVPSPNYAIAVTTSSTITEEEEEKVTIE